MKTSHLPTMIAEAPQGVLQCDGGVSDTMSRPVGNPPISVIFDFKVTIGGS